MPAVTPRSPGVNALLRKPVCTILPVSKPPGVLYGLYEYSHEQFAGQAGKNTFSPRRMCTITLAPNAWVPLSHFRPTIGLRVTMQACPKSSPITPASIASSRRTARSRNRRKRRKRERRRANVSFSVFPGVRFHIYSNGHDRIA